MTQQLPSYRNPPIAEVAIGCRFRKLESLKIAHFGVFWQKFRTLFPIVEHAPPIAADGGLPPEDPTTGLTLPRLWLINGTESRLIQLQVDRLHYNWRRRDGESEYPRYESIVGAFEETFESFERVAEELGLGVVLPEHYELSYINHLQKGVEWDVVSDLPNVFPDLVWGKKSFLPFPDRIAWNWGFSMPDQAGIVQVKLTSAALASEPPVPIFVLELTARGPAIEKTSRERNNWFSLARQWIVRGFADLTSIDIQNRVWGKE